MLAEDPMGTLINSGSFNTWTNFCTAVKVVSDEEIESAVEEEKRISTVEEKSKKLGVQLLLQSPMAPLRTEFSAEWLQP
ncbi:hypothetical protein PILCRDRAFT_7090 [Piloderma croceum F 1598]|uniref:Uncharacterized protein n=1 Tax=Piloderma croceum (strain F 1598) TaxID=765440 RepID=A0A0C3BBM6_PILCF|nr:hypothetical protein PILCRDRAFT_7090 [Piloderma croceum F 1598]